MSAALSHRFASLDGRLSGGFARDNITLPYSGNAVPTSGPGLSNMGTLGVPMSEDHNMGSHMDTDGLESETHSCPHCEKQFGRLCDLNKHAKSHSRPFKCAFQNCKYWSLGWPTAKELERHVNDKHSAAPQTYPCLFQHCSYKSKRESNCKQHMEKTHGWRYVRSKSNARRVSVSRRAVSQLAVLQTFLPTGSPQSLSPKSNEFKPSTNQARNDFVLFPQEHDHVPSDDDYDDDGYMDLDDRGSQGSDVVIPWTSPDTRLRRRETFLQKFTQSFNNPDDDLPIDPQLASVGGIDTLSKPNSADSNINSKPGTDRTAGTRRNASIKEEHTMYASTLAFPSTPFSSALQQRTAGSVPPPNHSRSSSSANGTQSAVAASRQHPMYQVPKTSKRKEDENPDDEHPQKKFKPSSRSNFKDNQMPDIFLAAYPEVYNRETKSSYQSCETEHRDISTLVRHLSRVPHRLHVSERCIHSFDVEPVELSHAKCGVCRRCWVVFTNRDAFDNHLLTECEKVSRGKREKWQILYDSFTPLATETMSPGYGQPTVNATQPLPLPNDLANNPSAYGAPPSVDEDGSPVPPASPTTIDLGPRVPLELEGDGEVEKLRRENRQLKAIVRVVLNQAKGVMDLSRLVAPSLLEAVEGGNELPSGSEMRQQGRLTFPGNGFVEHDTPDAAALVGQMNSHPTDVDRQGMIEDIQQTFSRTSSGMSSSDKSTIRHVSNSPPQRYEAYHGDNSSTPRPRPVNPSGGPTPIRHQPTSLPDSGYGSDKKRNSISGPDIVEQTNQVFPLPGHSISAIPQDQTALATSGSPVIQVRAEEPDPRPGSPVNLQLDSLLPSSGMSPDPFANQDEADAYYLSKDLMEQFGDPGYSQPSSSSFQS